MLTDESTWLFDPTEYPEALWEEVTLTDEDGEYTDDRVKRSAVIRRIRTVAKRYQPVTQEVH